MLVHVRQIQYLLFRQITAFQAVHVCTVIKSAVVQQQQVGTPPSLLYIHSKSNLQIIKMWLFVHNECQRKSFSCARHEYTWGSGSIAALILNLGRR